MWTFHIDHLLDYFYSNLHDENNGYYYVNYAKYRNKYWYNKTFEKVWNLQKCTWWMCLYSWYDIQE